jgi:hypothetical protein
MRVYPAFSGFYGMEDSIERIVGFFRHAARGSKSARRASICRRWQAADDVLRGTTELKVAKATKA